MRISLRAGEKDFAKLMMEDSNGLVDDLKGM